MAVETLTIISYLVVLGLFASILLPEKTHYTVTGFILIALGVLPLLFSKGLLPFDPNQFPVVNFAVYFVTVLAGKDLFRAGFEEDQNKLRWPTMLLGIFLILFTSVPTLHKMEVIGWDFPVWPQMIDNVIYMVAGVFLIISAFTLLHEYK